MDRLNMFMMTPTSAKFCGFLLVSIMLAGTFLSVAISSSNGSIIITNTGVISTTSGLHYPANAVWIQDAAWSGFPKSKNNILSTNLTGLVADLANNYIEFAIVFVGYWNATVPSSPTITYQHGAAFYQNVISAFHAKSIKVIAWAEDGGGGTMDVTAGNRQNVYNPIIGCMNIGFDGYSDDIEGDTTGQWDSNWVSYVNGLTTILHNTANFTDGKSRLNMPAVPYDWQQDLNPNLHVDYILSMFYSNVSTFESVQGYLYWQEDFGELGQNTPPANPIIIGIMNYYGNQHPLAWQLNTTATWIAQYGHPKLSGFCFWLYEYMGSRPDGQDDWSQWNNWTINIG